MSLEGSRSMHRRMTLQLALLAIATLLLGLVAPAGASAQAQRRIAVRGGTTTLTTAPGLVTKLLGAKIVSFVTGPGTQSLVNSGKTLVAKYPVTTGTVARNPLRGAVNHKGGLFITNVSNGKSLAVDNFRIDITHKILTAHLVGAPANVRPTVFTLNFSRAAVVVRSAF